MQAGTLGLTKRTIYDTYAVTGHRSGLPKWANKVLSSREALRSENMAQNSIMKGIVTNVPGYVL